MNYFISSVKKYKYQTYIDISNVWILWVLRILKKSMKWGSLLHRSKQWVYICKGLKNLNSKVCYLLNLQIWSIYRQIHNIKLSKFVLLFFQNKRQRDTLGKIYSLIKGGQKSSFYLSNLYCYAKFNQSM